MKKPPGLQRERKRDSQEGSTLFKQCLICIFFFFSFLFQRLVGFQSPNNPWKKWISDLCQGQMELNPQHPCTDWRKVPLRLIFVKHLDCIVQSTTLVFQTKFLKLVTYQWKGICIFTYMKFRYPHPFCKQILAEGGTFALTEQKSSRLQVGQPLHNQIGVSLKNDFNRASPR